LPGDELSGSPVDEADDGGMVFPLKDNAQVVRDEMNVDVNGKARTRRNHPKEILERGGLKMRPNYSFRQGNWEIGRIPEQEGHAQKVRKFDRSDRFLAWRRREAKKARNAEKRSLGVKQGKAKGKKSKR